MNSSCTPKTVRHRTSHVLCVITFLILTGIITGQAGAFTAEYYVNSTGYWEERQAFVPSVDPIHAACNDAVSGARVMVVETGVYNDTVYVTAASPTDITLDLSGATLQQTTGTAVCVTGSSGWTIRNGTISGYTTGISLGGSIFDCILEDLTITGTAQESIYLGTEAATLTNVIIEDCEIQAPGNTGIRNYKSTLDTITISNVTVDHPGTNGIQLADYSSYSRTITGLVLEDVIVTGAGNTGIALSMTDAASTAPDLTNITITGATHTGLSVHAIQGTEITNLNVTACGSSTSYWGLAITGHSADMPVALDRITVQDCSAGISLNSVADVAITAEDTIRGNGHHQIALANVRNITVEDQEFRAEEGAFTHAISISGTATDIAIRNITVTGATQDAIYCGTDGATLTNVIIRDCNILTPGTTGIRNYKSNLDTVTISNVTVEHPGTNGIELADYSSYSRTITGLVIEDVTVTSAGNTGIALSMTDAASTAPDLTNITITGATHTGLSVHAIQGTEITNLNVTACGSSTSYWGLAITGHSADMPVALDRITVLDCSAGISLNSVADVAITAEDTIRGNGHHQIALANVRNITVEDQDFRAEEGAFTHAISISGTATDIAIQNITVAGATQDAIYCGTEGATLTNVIIRDCDIQAPGTTGIRNYKSTLDTVTISNVTVDHPGTNGIELADYPSYSRAITGLTIEDVTVTDAGNKGVTISETFSGSTAPVLTNITITGATHTGLSIHAIQGTEITNLNVTACGRSTSYWGLAITGNTADTPVALDRITVQDCSAGISLNSVADVAITAEDTIRGNGYYQIALANARNITVEDQEFLAEEGAFTRAISISGTATDIAIQNITVTGATQDAIYCGTQGATLTNVIIRDCDIQAPGATGIRNYESNLDTVTISNVTVDHPGTNGIGLEDYNSGNRPVTGLAMENITVSGAGNTGIKVALADESSNGVDLRDITVRESVNTGISVAAMGASSLVNVTATACGSSNSYWGISYSSPGTDLTLDRLTILNSTNGMYLKGAQNTVLGRDVTLTGNSGTQIALDNAENITVQDHTFTNALQAYTYAIRFTGTSEGITIANITAISPTYDLLNIAGTVTNLTAGDLTATTPGRHGIYAEKTLSNALFTNVTVTDPVNAGFANYYRYGDMADITFRDWTVTTPGADGGIKIIDSSPSGYNTPIRAITMERVNVTGGAGPGIYLMQNANTLSGGATFTDCRAANNTGTGIQTTWRKAAVFDGITATGNGGYGLTLASVAGDAKAPVVRDWTVTGNAGGVSLTGVHDTSLAPPDQQIQDNTGAAIYLNGVENITLEDYTFTNTVQAYEYAVHIAGNSDGITLVNITAVSPDYELLNIGGNIANLTANDLTATTPGRHGIYAYRSLTNVTFANITVTDPANAGFENYYRYGNMDTVTFRDWTVTTPGTDGGIKITDSSPSQYNTPITEITFERVNVTGGAGPGIYLSQIGNSLSRDVVFSHCHIEDNAGTGIETTWRGTAVLDTTEVVGSGGYGLKMTGVSGDTEAPEVTACSVTKNTGGIFLSRVHDTALAPSALYLEENTGTQIYLSEVANMTVRDYQFTDAVQPYDYAVLLTGTTENISLSNITAVSPTQELLYTAGSITDLTARDLTVTTPKQNGVYTYGALTNALFENVTVTDPVNAGFENYYRYGNMDTVTFRDWTITTPGADGGIKITDSSPSQYNTPIRDITMERVNVTDSAGGGISISQNRNTAGGGITISDISVTNASASGVTLLYRGTADIRAPAISDCGDAGSEAGIFAHGYGTHALFIAEGNLSRNYYGIRLENASAALVNDTVVLASNMGGLYIDAATVGMTASNLSFNTTTQAGLDASPEGGIVLDDAWSGKSTPYPVTGIFAGVQPLSTASAVNITVPVTSSPAPADLRLFITHDGDDWAILPEPNNATVTGPDRADVSCAIAPASLPETGTWYTVTPLLFATGEINVTSVPDGAWVWLDGVNMSVTANTTLTDIPVGTHTVMVTREGYLNATNTNVTVVSNSVTETAFTLEKHWEIPLISGWNMISMPATGTSISWPAEVTENCYRYDGSVYVHTSRDALEPGTGYWIAGTAPCTVVIEGVPVSSYTLDCTAGWNMIGGTGETHTREEIATSPAGILTGVIYGYNGATYTETTHIEPGIGYWAALTNGGSISLR